MADRSSSKALEALIEQLQKLNADIKPIGCRQDLDDAQWGMQHAYNMAILLAEGLIRIHPDPVSEVPDHAPNCGCYYCD